MDPQTIKLRLCRELEAHRYDSVSQDSGSHCICGSDSRFVQQLDGRLDDPWNNFGEHQADVAMYWLRKWGYA
jgi:hypothetical protein